MFKKLFCKHDYEGYSFNYAKCNKCGKTIYSPKIVQEKIDRFCSGMIKAGHWTQEEVAMRNHSLRS